MDRIVFAYVGGFEPSIAIPWIADRYRAEVVTVTVDLGQGGLLEDVRDRALAAGAARAHVVDARDEFARDFVLPSLQAGAVDGSGAPLSPALGRALVAKHLVAVARLEGATIVAHGGAGTSAHAGWEALVSALDPALTVVAPRRLWGFTPADALDYARRHGLPAPGGLDAAAPGDANLWARTTSCGSLDPWDALPEDLFVLTRAPADAPDEPAYVEVDFDGGVPVAINDVAMGLVELIQSLQTIAGAHGVGRLDVARPPVAPSGWAREVSEAPAAVVLRAAHAAMQQLVVPPDLDRLLANLGTTYARLIDDGLWHTLSRQAIDACVAEVQAVVTGRVRLKLSKGACQVVGRRSANAPTAACAADEARGRADERAGLETGITSKTLRGLTAPLAVAGNSR